MRSGGVPFVVPVVGCVSLLLLGWPAGTNAKKLVSFSSVVVGGNVV